MRYLTAFFILAFGLILFPSNLAAQDLVMENGIYVDSKSHEPCTGIYQVRYENGNLAAVYNLLDGKLHRGVVQYFEDGGIRETGHFEHNERHGLWLQWSERGNLVSQAQFQHGEKHGKWIFWDESGNQRVKTEYNQGSSIGVWQVFNEYAELIDQRKLD
jgi:antitoxin component YwqK of YwqJK toxin-antitoxin module